MKHLSKLNHVIICLIFTVFCLGVPNGDVIAAKGGGGKGGGNAGSGGDPEPVYTAAGDLINADSIDSTNLSFDEIIFRPSADFTFDLSGFDVAGPAGSYCPGFSRETTGTLVLAPGDSAVQNSAELRFGFQGDLSDNGNTVQHFLIMQGDMDGDWPPTGVTTLVFHSWELAAENKKSQRSDCDGDGSDLNVIIGIAPASP